jgi:hypothetical protein
VSLYGTTFGRLKASFSDATQKVEIGKWNNLDYQIARVDTAIIDQVALAMRKRKSFEYEQELRAIH